MSDKQSCLSTVEVEQFLTRNCFSVRLRGLLILEIYVFVSIWVWIWTIGNESHYRCFFGSNQMFSKIINFYFWIELILLYVLWNRKPFEMRLMASVSDRERGRTAFVDFGFEFVQSRIIAACVRFVEREFARWPKDIL